MVLISFYISSMSKSHIYHAYFSQTAKNNRMNHKERFSSESFQNKVVLSNIYLSQEGKEVEITEVCQEKKEKFNFEDMEYRGIVVKWIRTIFKL